MKRTLTDAGTPGAAPAHPAAAAPATVAPRAEPDLSAAPAARPAPRVTPQPTDEMGLDIPTFLRRQSN
jgi:hypothetical protein